MSFGDYEDVLTGFSHLRVRTSTLTSFGFHRKGRSGWEYIVPIGGTSLECRVTISAKGVISEKVVDLASGDDYALYRVANATGRFVGLVREAVTELLRRIAASCFERDVFILERSRALLETVRSRWNEELEFLWEDSPECAVLRRTDTGKWYAVMMRLSGRKFGLENDAVSEFILLRTPRDAGGAILSDSRFLPAYHMNKRTWFAIRLDGSVELAEILQLAECSRKQAVKK